MENKSYIRKQIATKTPNGTFITAWPRDLLYHDKSGREYLNHLTGQNPCA